MRLENQRLTRQSSYCKSRSFPGSSSGSGSNSAAVLADAQRASPELLSTLAQTLGLQRHYLSSEDPPVVAPPFSFFLAECPPPHHYRHHPVSVCACSCSRHRPSPKDPSSPSTYLCPN